MEMNSSTTLEKMPRYNNLNGIRALAAIGVICMHVKTNIGYEVAGGSVANYVINQWIGAMGSFVQLFFVISGFSMCCGYYEKIKNREIDPNGFYSRRYAKILPFFALLVIIDLAVGLLFDGGIRAGSIYEAFAELTLMFGLMPPFDITIIGVGWTLGVIFGFYILFPFFVFLLWNKRRAWFSLLLMLVINYLCGIYFLVDGAGVAANTMRWLCYFVMGGLIYLYKDAIGAAYQKAGKKAGTAVGLVLVLAGLVIVYGLDNPARGDMAVLVDLIKGTLGYTLVVAGAIGFETVIWNNPVSRHISNVSLEIYIAHMLVFRVIEKLGLTRLAGEGVLSYILVCIGTIVGVLLFVNIYLLIEKKVTKSVKKLAP